MKNSAITYIAIIITAIISIIIAHKMGDTFDQNHPDQYPYKWGFYVGWQTFLSGLVFAALSIINPALLVEDLHPKLGQDYHLSLSIFASISFLAMSVIGFYIIKRTKWAWIVGTVLSLNPIFWVINGVYVKNRWNELGKQK